MEQVTEAIGNPTALFIERIFWLGLGGFLGLSIITSLIRGSDKIKRKNKPSSVKELEDLAEKAIQQNSNINHF
tara:strand:+ start:269 stop:487 length:219 start_codon:yes stop_codon:yes gene_type:complete